MLEEPALMASTLVALMGLENPPAYQRGGAGSLKRSTVDG